MADETNSSPASVDDGASPMTDGDAPEATPSSPSSTTSVLGMSLVSALNVACLLFIAYHFSTHGDQPMVAAPIELRGGNVSFEAVSGHLLTIASHVDQTQLDNEEIPVEEVVAAQIMPSTPAQPEEAARPTELQRHWVQLGALSKIVTARSHWEKLLKGHDSLLSLYKPSIIGPDQVGGSLFHLRVGPLPANEAAKLCSDLEQAGADCFCVSADGKQSDHTDMKTPNTAWPEPS